MSKEIDRIITRFIDNRNQVESAISDAGGIDDFMSRNSDMTLIELERSLAKNNITLTATYTKEPT